MSTEDMASGTSAWLALTALLVLSSCNWMLAGGQNCTLKASEFSLHTVTVSAEREDVSTPGARVTWSTTVPPECVASVTVEFRTSSSGSVVRSYTTTSTSETEVIQTGLQCGTTYYIRVVVTAVASLGTLISNEVEVLVGDIPTPERGRAEVTADNTSIRVMWEWSSQGLLMCLVSVRVEYQLEGGSLMVDNATATSATLSNLQCNTQYNISVHAEGGKTKKRSVTRRVFLPARAPPTPTEVTVQVANASSVGVRWQWTSSGPAPSCFNTTRVTYHPEGGGESFLQLMDPAATETILTGLQCNTHYNITVEATVGEHRRESAPRTLVLQDERRPSADPGARLSTDPGATSSSIYPGTTSSSTDPGATSSSIYPRATSSSIYPRATSSSIYPGATSSSIYPRATSSSSDLGTRPSADPGVRQSPDSGLLAGVAVFVIVLLLAAVCIVVFTIWWRRRQGRKSMKVTAVGLANIVADTDSKEEQDTTTDVDNICYERVPISPPTIVDYQQEVLTLEGKQVTLTVKVAGSPTPTITWFFNGEKMKDDYPTEVGKDGSLTLICVELKHAGTYTFSATNSMGSVEGCTKLMVHTEDEDYTSTPTVESNPVAKEKLGEYVFGLHAHNNEGFIVQYQTLPSGEEGHQVTIGKTSANRLLNRFRNITAYDDHRVVLEPISGHLDCQHDYMNASYIDGYSQHKKYIATQGPLPNTITDFWWLVWQERICLVAMVTNVVERGQQKCEQYWPSQGTQEYGPFKVTLIDQQVFADYTVRQLFVACDQGGRTPLKVTQFHFTSWPDHGVPEYAGPTLNYLRRMKVQVKPSRGSILVHCSAGVGRTGTLIAIDTALEQAAQEDVVDIRAIVTKMRRQRMKMVQSPEQYVFIHDAVLESLTCGDTQIPASGLISAIEKLKQRDSDTGRTGFETQFHVLNLVTPKPTEVIRTSAFRFRDVNRSMDFLPPDTWRVVLKGEDKDYIHASFANGYKQYKGFIITQAPMKFTCRDFWKMIYERECGVVVMLSDLVENGMEVCHQYWPTGDTKGVQKYGEFNVSVLQATQQDGFIQRMLSVTNPKSGQLHKVMQFQMSCWTPEGLCTSPHAIVDIIEQVLVIQRRTGNRPIVVHGSDTVSRCGVFCSLINATECCKTEGIVDVFQVVKALRIQKPGIVLTVEQYHFIFDLMLLFLDSFSIYSNFK